MSEEAKVNRYREVSQFIADVGEICWTALDELGIIPELHPITSVPLSTLAFLQ